MFTDNDTVCDNEINKKIVKGKPTLPSVKAFFKITFSFEVARLIFQIHLVCGTGIRTHDLFDTSLLP